MNIDFKKLGVLLLPPLLRDVKLLLSLLEVIGSYFNSLKKTNDDYFNALNIEVRTTPAVFSLEKMLNDRLDSINRRIKIAEPLQADMIWLYNEEEERTNYIYPVLYLAQENRGGYAVDFIIEAPASLQSKVSQIKGLTDKYRLIGKIYNVILK